MSLKLDQKLNSTVLFRDLLCKDQKTSFVVLLWLCYVTTFGLMWEGPPMTLKAELCGFCPYSTWNQRSETRVGSGPHSGTHRAALRGCNLSPLLPPLFPASFGHLSPPGADAGCLDLFICFSGGECEVGGGLWGSGWGVRVVVGGGDGSRSSACPPGPASVLHPAVRAPGAAPTGVMLPLPDSHTHSRALTLTHTWRLPCDSAPGRGESPAY